MEDGSTFRNGSVWNNDMDIPDGLSLNTSD